NLQQWFEQAAPGPDGTPDFFVFDRINRGVITLHGFMDYEADFNNGAYNDHMFHYGYFIYAAAVLSRYDSQWFNQNREKVNTLVRDIANPSLNDPYFPLMRTFDWFRLQNFADSGPDANGANTE